MIKRYSWLLLLLIILSCNNEQPAANQVRGFDSARIEKYNASERYNYDRVVEHKPNYVLIFFGKILSGIAWFLSSVFGYIALAFLVGLLIYVIFKYVNKERLTYEEKTTGLRIIDESNVENVDFDKLLSKALSNKDYRLAIRFSFLSALKVLSLEKLIKMKEGKTNFDYYYELPGNIKPTYKQILSTFEYVWYGEFPADAGLYSEVSKQTKELSILINKTDA